MNRDYGGKPQITVHDNRENDTIPREVRYWSRGATTALPQFVPTVEHMIIYPHDFEAQYRVIQKIPVRDINKQIF